MRVSLLLSRLLRHKRLAVGAALGFLLYTAFGFLVLPAVVRVIAVKQFSAHLDRTVMVQKVRLNPYLLSASIRGLWITDQESAPLLAGPRLLIPRHTPERNRRRLPCHLLVTTKEQRIDGRS